MSVRIPTLPHLDNLLGIAARAMFVLVKPAALWAAILLDDDAGTQLAQVYLIGLLMVSLTGTNAHRAFYRARFEEADMSGVFATAQRYHKYIEDLGQQILAVVVAATACASILPAAMTEFVLIGIVFGLAEKISDEMIRYSQFCLNNRRLMVWALAKVTASAAAVVAGLAAGFKISLGFPLFLLLFVSFLAYQDVRLALKAITVKLRQGFGRFARSVLELFRRDAGQIAWVFTTMGLMSVDKWTLQIFSTAHLAQYMFVAQFAAIFIVAQTTFILAPARVELVNRDPGDITGLQRGSMILTGLAWLAGLAVTLYTVVNVGGDLLYFPFFIAGIFVLSAPYLERLYWVAPDYVRIGLDVSFIMMLGLALIFIRMATGNWPEIHISLTLLTGVLLLRLVGIWAVIRYH